MICQRAHLEGNDTTISNMVSACEVRKKIKDGYRRDGL